MGNLKSKPQTSKHKQDHKGRRIAYVRLEPTRYDLSSYPESMLRVQQSRESLERDIQSTTTNNCSSKDHVEAKTMREQELDGKVSRAQPQINLVRKDSATCVQESHGQKTVKKSDFPLVIAIDIGTSYSAFGYQFLDEYEKDPMDISIPRAYNGGKQNLLSRKTSTCILINVNGEVENFGYEADERYEEICLLKKNEQFYFFKNFKTKLQELKGLRADFLLTEETGSKELPAIIVFSLAVKSLMDHAIEYIRNERRDISESNILWALTVPAIWDESATQFMKDSAVKAGIKRENLQIVYEPEAASFACRYLPVSTVNQTTHRPYFSEVPIGTLYMIVHLGGRTADIVIHKKIDQRRVKEISRPSGGPWGGTAVDSQFQSFLIKIGGEKVFMKFKQTCPLDYADLMQEFKMPSELSNVCRQETGQDLQATVQETEYRHKIVFLGDKALIDPEIFYGFFEPVAKNIVKHVKTILDSRHGSKVALLLMVGGFSESKYIQTIMKSEFQRDTMDVLIPKDPGMSVIKGAVVIAREETLLAFRFRNVICVAALHIGRNTTAMAIQFRDKFQHNPNQVLCVPFLDSNGVLTLQNSTCVLFDQTMNLNSVGNEAEKRYKQLCDISKEKDWHFFKDFYLSLEEQEDNFELTLRDQENIPMKAINIMSIYISHALKHLENLYRQQGGFYLMQDTHFVFTAPADWSERECIRLLSEAAEMAGLKEERITVILESEAINQYCKNNIVWNNLNVAGAPIGSIIVIANLAEAKGELTFHEKRSIGSVTGAYKTVSGPWGTQSLSEGFMQFLTLILGKDLIEQFKREYPNIYSDLCKTIALKGKSIRLDKGNNVNLRVHKDGEELLKMEFNSLKIVRNFPVENFDVLCRRNFFKSFRECVEDSEYCAKIKVANVKLDVDVSLFKGICSRVTDAIVGHVKEHQMAGGIKRKIFFALTGSLSDYEMITTTILPKLENLGVMTVIIKSEESPVLKGAIAYGFTCE